MGLILVPLLRWQMCEMSHWLEFVNLNQPPNESAYNLKPDVSSASHKSCGYVFLSKNIARLQ